VVCFVGPRGRGISYNLEKKWVACKILQAKGLERFVSPPVCQMLRINGAPGRSGWKRHELFAAFVGMAGPSAALRFAQDDELVVG
jgi:hypothetical protein